MWVPGDSKEVVILARPPDMVLVPTETPPSKNVTVPVGMPLPGKEAVTVDVKVITWPKTPGFSEEVMARVVSALFTTCIFPVTGLE